MSRQTSKDRADRLARVTGSPVSQAPPPFAPELAETPSEPLEQPATTTPPVIGEPDPPSSRRDDGKVRTTVVLDADEYNALRRFCLEVEGETRRRGVAGSEVLRVLLGRLDSDSDLRASVLDEIGKHGGNRRR